ncbi:MAG: T9SS type A sorting domain-containing protein [Candidatus Marinimicrobia bacterium]|nr:T9SS type A sorting domain-containing protein [Candidatus Neomarinimicrobiota bacterium]
MKKQAIILTCILILTAIVNLTAKNINERNLSKHQILSVGSFDGNRIHADLENDGMLVSHRISGHSGLEWPQGEKTYSVYAAGLWFAGKVNGEIRTAISEYAPEYTQGPWGSNGEAVSDKLYKVNISDLNNPDLNPDFAAWPVQLGAPWVDADNDGIYTPMPSGPDHPEFIGDQVIYYVMNDGISDNHRIFNTEPLGLELHMTIWGYNNYFDFLDDVMFVKAQVFNKGGNEIDSLYISVWSDPDLGNGGDDYVGCDVSRSLGFCYNDGPDLTYGEAAPAVGVDLLRVAVPSADPEAEQYCFGSVKTGFQGLPMTSFIKYIGGDDVYTDPNDAGEAYNYMAGFRRDGSPFINSATGETSKFVHSDDPNLNFDDTDNIWVDGDDNQADDRRMLLSSGPFAFSPGDSAEVVLALLHGQGISSLSSVTTLKHTDDVVQSLFNNNFVRAALPPAPELTSTASAGEIILEWDDNAESYSEGFIYPYVFEGYNIYQHASTDSTSNRILLATFDLINGVRRIWDNIYEPDIGEFIFRPIQFGADTGIQHFLIIQEDTLNGNSTLIDDREYYFSVTAYAHNGLMRPSSLESKSQIIAIRPQTNVYLDPALDIESDIPVAHSGRGNGAVTVKVINPYELAGDDYTVYFDQQHYYRNLAGLWLQTNYPDSIGKLGKSNDLTGTVITAAAIASTSIGTIDLVYTLNYVSPDGAWIDGFELDLPDDITVNSWGTVEGPYSSYGTGSGQNTVNSDGTFEPGNIITWGDSARSTFGAVEGDAYVRVNIEPVTFPFTTGYKVFDDGYATVVDVAGTITITELGYEYKSIKHWNLMNSAGDKLLEDMTTLNGQIFDYVDTDGVFHKHTSGYSGGPGTGENVGTSSIPVVDGFQIKVEGSYYAPINFASTILSENLLGGTTLSSNSNTTNIDIQNYTIFGGTISSKAIDNFGVGTTSMNELQDDLELRFTGILDTNVVNGQTQITVVSGGSMATIFRFANGFAAHPLANGATEAFMIRIPFEVWNIDKGIQVNLTFRDRVQTATAEPFYAWNMVNRMYAVIVNSPYDPVTPIPVDNGRDALNALATWVLVFYGTNYQVGDVVEIRYDNPIQLGIDTFNFSTEAATVTTPDLNQIKVWPNPYFAQNPEEQSYFDSRIHFINLPEIATIKIVNLAGQVVRVLEHSGSQETVWDVRTANNSQVASGVYLALVETEYGIRVLKLAVVARQM